MTEYVIFVEFRLKAGTRAEFVEIVRVNAAASVRDEPGCRRFDVLVPENDDDRVALYEIYDDEAAFKAHLETPHFARFRDGTAALIEDRDVRVYLVHQNA